MASLAMTPRPASVSPIAELLRRQRTLGFYGLAMLAFTGVTLLLQQLDPRLLESGINIWVKPAKFFFSVAVFTLTTAWFFGYVRPGRRGSRPMRGVVWTIVITGSFELIYICWQAFQGLESHFNVSTPFHVTMYALMGVAAVLLVGTTLPLAWEIGRRPTQGLRPEFVAALVVGLVLTFLLGGGLGGYMSAQLSHSVGAEGGRTFLFGWNRSGGDLRIAHFLGIHAQQAIPMLGALVAGTAGTRWALLAAGSLAYVVVTVGLFVQAAAGIPLLPL